MKSLQGIMVLLLVLLIASGCNLLLPFVVGDVAGTVLDADENPVVAKIELWKDGEKTDIETESGADGTFSIQGLKSGTYTLVAVGEGVSGQEQVDVIARKTTDVTIIAQVTTDLSIEVSDNLGRPLIGAVLSIAGLPEEYKIGESGIIQLENIPTGTYEVTYHWMPYVPGLSQTQTKTLVLTQEGGSLQFKAGVEADLYLLFENDEDLQKVDLLTGNVRNTLSWDSSTVAVQDGYLFSDSPQPDGWAIQGGALKSKKEYTDFAVLAQISVTPPKEGQGTAGYRIFGRWTETWFGYHANHSTYGSELVNWAGDEGWKGTPVPDVTGPALKTDGTVHQIVLKVVGDTATYYADGVEYGSWQWDADKWPTISAPTSGNVVYMFTHERIKTLNFQIFEL